MSGERILVFVPAFNCAPQIGRVIGQLESVRGLVDETIVVDNQSSDDTLERATAALRDLDGLRWRVLLNDRNYGLGGSHKVAIAEGLKDAYDWLLVLHGDDQADVRDFVPLLRAGRHESLDAVLGARFMRGSRLAGYSFPRTVGNHVYNLLFSAVSRRRMHDLGSGLNLFRLRRFRDGAHLRFADDLTFNYHLCLHMAMENWNLRFVPISWREEDQRSNVKLVRQGLRTLGILRDFAHDRHAFAARDHSSKTGGYTAQTIASGGDRP